MTRRADDAPLVSPRSPSLARAWRELRHPSPTGDPIAVGLLNELVEVEHDARSACVAAAHQLAAPELVDRVRAAAGVHAERLTALGTLVEHLGGSPPTAAECRSLLVHGASEIQRASSDAAVTAELNAMYAELEHAYAKALAYPGLTDRHRELLRHLASPQPAG
jgi:uncharacterized protein (TIGR02284 family)